MRTRADSAATNRHAFGSLNLDDEIDLDGTAERECDRADRGAGVLTGLTEDLGEQFARVIGDFGLVIETRIAADEDADPNDLFDFGERADGGLDVGEAVKHALARAVGGLFHGDLGGNGAFGDQCAVLHRDLAGDEEEIATATEREVRGDGFGDGGESEAEFGEFRFGVVLHGNEPSADGRERRMGGLCTCEWG